MDALLPRKETVGIVVTSDLDWDSHLGVQLNFYTMAHVVLPLDQPSNYKDSQARIDRMKQNEMLSKSTTLYVSLHLSTRH